MRGGVSFLNVTGLGKELEDLKSLLTLLFYLKNLKSQITNEISYWVIV